MGTQARWDLIKLIRSARLIPRDSREEAARSDGHHRIVQAGLSGRHNNPGGICSGDPTERFLVNRTRVTLNQRPVA